MEEGYVSQRIVEFIVLPIIGAVIAIPITILFAEPINDFLAKLFGGLRAEKKRKCNGVWAATYTRLDASGVSPAKETIVFRQIGTRVVGKQVNDKKIRLKGKLRDRYLTGEWYDTRNGAFYHGAFQLIMEDDGKKITGRWIGFSSNKLNIRYGDWNLELLP